MDFEEIVQGAINAKAKVGLRSSTMVRESNAYCHRGHHLSHNNFSKVQTRETTVKEPHTEELRPKVAKSTNNKATVLPRSNEAAKPNREKKKQEWLKKNKDSTPVTGDNAIEGKKKRTSGNTSQVNCFNCQKGPLYK